MKRSRTIRVEDDRLLLRLHDNTNNIREGACVPIGETRFMWSGGLIEFQVAEDGRVPALIAVDVYTFFSLTMCSCYWYYRRY